MDVEEPQQDTAHVDSTTRAIVQQLQEDGRKSYAAIGKAIGMSEAAVRQRVNKALSSGIMSIVAVTDPRHMGFSRQAMVGVNAAGDVVDVADQLAAMPEINYVVVTTGRFDIMVDVVCADDEELLHVINDLIRKVPGVTATESFMYLALRKQEYNWGTL